MADLSHLYQAIILEHAQQPHHAELLTGEGVYSVTTQNRSCGDELQLTARFENDRVAAIGYQIGGCILSKASTSIMSDQVLDRPLSEVIQNSEDFSALMMGESLESTGLGDEAQIFHNVVSFPIRIKCVMLPWKALNELIEEYRNGR